MGAKTIVVIEDNALNLKLIVATLTRGGYRLFTSTDAETGLNLVREHLPDLVLMDIQLPGMDGFTATQRLKSDEVTKDIPVVALSAHAMPSHGEKAAAFGCAGYITKPFSTRSLLSDIEGYLQDDTCRESATVA